MSSPKDTFSLFEEFLEKHSGWDINLINKLHRHKISSLYAAVEQRKFRIANRLICSKADPNLGSDIMDCTPIHAAIANRDKDMVKLLHFRGGAKIPKHASNQANITLMESLVSSNMPAMIEIILSIEPRPKEDASLVLAIKLQRIECYHPLLSAEFGLYLIEKDLTPWDHRVYSVEPVTVNCPVFLNLYNQVSSLVYKSRMPDRVKTLILDMYFGADLHEDICEVIEWTEFTNKPERHFSHPSAKKLLESKENMLRNVFNVYAGLQGEDNVESLLDSNELIIMINDITQEVLPRPLQLNVADLMTILAIATKSKMLTPKQEYGFEDFVTILQFVTRVISRKIRKVSSVLREMFAEELRKLYQGNEYYKELKQVMEWMVQTAKRKGFAAE